MNLPPTAALVPMPACCLALCAVVELGFNVDLWSQSACFCAAVDRAQVGPVRRAVFLIQQQGVLAMNGASHYHLSLAGADVKQAIAHRRFGVF